MNAPDKNIEIADKISGILQDGLKIGADTQHYIDSTFSNPTIGELEDFLKDESSCETDSLMELLFFPEESTQLQLESLLDKTRLQEHDEQTILKLVSARNIQVCFRFPDGRGTLLMTADPVSLKAFIKRLNLLKILDPGLRSAVARHVRSALKTRCLVRLRNARPITAPHQILFLEAFFEKLKLDEDAFFEYVDFVLGSLNAIKDKKDIYKELMTYKKIYFVGLQKAAKLDKQLTEHNVETLLLSGTRVVEMDRADARKKIAMIDRISLAIFGKTDFFDLMPADGQSIGLDGLEDIDKLIKEFS
jgi:hypothetical protein